MRILQTVKPKLTFGVKEEQQPRELVRTKPRTISETGRVETPVPDVKRTGKIKDVLRDASRKAMLPGKRISRRGKTYYEYRRNRSDAFKSNL